MPEATTVRTLEAGAPGFPAGLLDLPNPPERLFVRGTLPEERVVAIVGSRAATPYGLAQAHRLAGDLAVLGFTVVSGLARGIDAAAHRGALDAGGHTVAVLPGSIDRISPSAHAELAERIARGGALVAEWESGRAAYRSTFLERNRLIAAMASATIVVEAAERSGALSTARVARSLGRPRLAVPGDIDRPTSRGCHALLRDGAHVCESAADVIDAIGMGEAPAAAAGDRPRGERAPDAATDAGRIAQRLRDGACGLDELSASAGLPVERTLAALLELEWAGLAVASAGQRWSLRGTAAP